MQKYTQFEQAIADLFRKAGGDPVLHNVQLGGAQIDILVNIRWAALPVRIVVECKDQASLVGRKVVHDFGDLVNRLRLANKVDIGALVAKSGFTTDARKAAKLSSLYLLNPEDIIGWSSSSSHHPTYGSEAYMIIDVLEGINYDKRIEKFLRLVNIFSKARKFTPAVHRNYLLRLVSECEELAISLKPIHRAISEVLRGMLEYDANVIESAERHFLTASNIADKERIHPLFLECLFWLSRCYAEKRQFKEALEVLNRALNEAREDPVLTNWRVKAIYWKAKIHWLSYKAGSSTLSIKDIRGMFRESFLFADEFGLVNYAEGARARLGEIELEEGNTKEALELLILSERRTPNAQDKEKLKSSIARARHLLSHRVASSIEQAINNEPLLTTDFRGLKAVNPMVQVCDYAVWRFAKYQKDKILPHLYGEKENWYEGIRFLLENDELLEYCIDADRYQRRKDGLLLDTGGKKYRSLRAQLRASGWKPKSLDISRRLRMCKNILITSALVSDTGRNGSIALTPLSSDASKKVAEGRDGYFKLKSSGKFGYAYTSKHRKSLSADMCSRLIGATSNLISSFIEHSAVSGVFPMSVDFLVEENDFQVLEVHYPSRGFEVLYAPFRDLTHRARFPLELFAELMAEYSATIKADSVLLAQIDDFQDDSIRSRSEFYGFEFSRIADELSRTLHNIDLKICERWSSTSWHDGHIEYSGIRPTIVLLSDMDPLNPIRLGDSQLLLPDERLFRHVSDRKLVKEHCLKLGLPSPAFTVFEGGTSIQELLNKLGAFVVIKDRYHLPSWHSGKRRSEFLDLRDPNDCEKLARRAEISEILVEKVVLSSLDLMGHCGELRIHACGLA